MNEKEEILNSHENLNQVIIDNALDAIISIDSDASIMTWNKQAELYFNLTWEDVAGESLFENIITPGSEDVYEFISKFVEEKRTSWQRVDTVILNNTGHDFHVELAISACKVSGLSVYTLFIRDISERKKVEEELRHDALHDGLTGLPNRELFQHILSDRIEYIKGDKEHLFAVLFLDLNNFKDTNDKFGHICGDKLLFYLAQRLQEAVRPGDTVARFGGDEFAIILDGIQDMCDATCVANRIHKKLEAPFNIYGKKILSSVSVGIVQGTEKHKTPEMILHEADMAMYYDKIHSNTYKNKVFNHLSDIAGLKQGVNVI